MVVERPRSRRPGLKGRAAPGGERAPRSRRSGRPSPAARPPRRSPQRLDSETGVGGGGGGRGHLGSSPRAEVRERPLQAGESQNPALEAPGLRSPQDVGRRPVEAEPQINTCGSGGAAAGPGGTRPSSGSSLRHPCPRHLRFCLQPLDTIVCDVKSGQTWQVLGMEQLGAPGSPARLVGAAPSSLGRDAHRRHSRGGGLGLARRCHHLLSLLFRIPSPCSSLASAEPHGACQLSPAAPRLSAAGRRTGLHTRRRERSQPGTRAAGCPWPRTGIRN